MRTSLLCLLAVLIGGCAHNALSGSELGRVNRPAFIARMHEAAGPRSTVFRDDGAYKKKLGRLDAAEADRRLTKKLGMGMSRFQLAEGLRANTVSRLPQGAPWDRAADPTAVARLFESFLVDEVPANAPDYPRLRELGADTVVEFVIEDYGMRSRNGRAGLFLTGYGRMFTLDGGELWRRSFRVDQVDDQSAPHVDPFRIAQQPQRFRDEMNVILQSVAAQFAKDLSPQDHVIRASIETDDGSDQKANEAAPAPAEPSEESDLPAPDPL